ncbi:two component transcriptional regulator [Caballeronia temeraria]|uniref:Two component transcriptional regulator n=1 Tax=Caballeronia temeraria TaxID=1777137 RepID=A0A158BX34_9BURK|nr:response regulator [Caballeronia temeraria]SAK74679.1 two component transcriptional regulator [Caballeronia temeraria]
MANLVVVDDESLVTDFLKFLLEDAGHVVHVASNGAEGLQTIQRIRPSLVVTDFMMPVSSGVDLARALSSDDDFRQIPIVLCSAAPHAVEPADRALFVAILQKPYPPFRLTELVALQVKEAPSGGGAGRSDEQAGF